MRKRHLSQFEQYRLIEHFVAGTSAGTAAKLCAMNHKPGEHFDYRLREIIAFETDSESERMFGGEIEVDKSYFVGRPKGKREHHDVANKTLAFGLLKRGGRVYAKVIANASSARLYQIIEHNVVPDIFVYSDGWKTTTCWSMLAFKHFGSTASSCLPRTATTSTASRISTNNAKCHMRRFNGIPKTRFPFYLKECALRFNHHDPAHQVLTL